MKPLHKIDTGSGVETARSGDLPEPRAVVASGGAAPPRATSAQAAPAGAPERGATLLLYTVLLSGVGGYVDAAGFVALLGFFPNHLTGELVGDAIAISSGQWAAHVARLWMFPVFISSIALSSLVARFLRRRRQPELTGLLALLTASLALFSACDAVAHLLHHRHLPLWFSGACAVTAMGFQTALIRVSLSGSCPTTVMTGNLAQVIVDLLDRLVAARDARASQRARLVSACGALAAFASCATLGGWLTQRFGTLSVIVPTAVTAALAVRAWVEDRRSRFSVPSAVTASPWFSEEDDLWPDSSETEALAPLYGVELESVTRLKNEPAVAANSGSVSGATSIADPPRFVSGTRPVFRSDGDK